MAAGEHIACEVHFHSEDEYGLEVRRPSASRMAGHKSRWEVIVEPIPLDGHGLSAEGWDIGMRKMAREPCRQRVHVADAERWPLPRRMSGKKRRNLHFAIATLETGPNGEFAPFALKARVRMPKTGQPRGAAGPRLARSQAMLPPVDVRRRSAALQADPKAVEMRHFLGSKNHERRMRERVGLAEREQTLTSMDKAARVLHEATESAKEGGLDTRLEWRDEMDRRVKRLMLEADLSLEDTLQEFDQARLRCEQLDKTYAWFQKHGRKEAAKERAMPSFLRFDSSRPAMPGSLRNLPRVQPSFTGLVPEAQMFHSS
ncbi:unnamed protein product [Effrenium voratum]|uniref:Uncharacterized protein n=1 Tax=Effrenium voratum TaxID=2562239 RepID=A0AA36J979_9DINO|nr:unnamed protein product [Effrenium voratum]